MSNKIPDLSLLDLSLPDFAPDEDYKKNAFERDSQNKNAFSNWFGAVKDSGVRYPATITLPLSIDLQTSMMGDPVATDLEPEIETLVSKIQAFAKEHGDKLFMKTAFTSNKHSWEES